MTLLKDSELEHFPYVTRESVPLGQYLFYSFFSPAPVSIKKLLHTLFLMETFGLMKAHYRYYHPKAGTSALKKKWEFKFKAGLLLNPAAYVRSIVIIQSTSMYLCACSTSEHKQESGSERYLDSSLLRHI